MFCVLFIDIFCELSFVYFKVLCILHICVLFVYLALCCSLCLDLFVLARGLPCGPHPSTPSERQYAILYLGKPLHKKSTVQTVFVQIYNIIWEFFTTWGGGLPKSQNFCKFTKYFFVCQIHSEVLKHVLQMGG